MFIFSGDFVARFRLRTLRFSLFLLLAVHGLPTESAAQAILDVAALPTKSERAKAGYQAFLIRHTPRAFAMTADGGVWGYSSQQNLSDTREAAIARALEGCNKNAKPGQPCRLYAVDLDVVWNGETAAPVKVPNAPTFDPFTPMKGFFLRGPAVAKGVVVWAHGKGTDDGRRYPAQPYVRLLNNLGWDVYAFGRHWNDDSLSVGLNGTRKGMAAIQSAGYRKIVLAGQSRGAWQSLSAVAGPVHPFAIVAAAPGAGGDSYADGYLGQIAPFKEMLETANNPAVRVAIFFFNGDPREDSGKRGPIAHEILSAKGNPLFLLDRPEGVTGHGGGGSYPFTDRYGACLVRFLESAELPKPFAC